MKIVLFDIGGVIENHDAQSYNTKNAIVDTIHYFNTDISNEEILKKWTWNVQIDGKNTILGRVNDINAYNEWIKSIKNTFNIKASNEEFINVYKNNAKNIKVFDEVINLINELNEKNILVGLFSDTVFLASYRLKEELDMSKISIVFLSYLHGYRKTENESYIYVEKVLKNTFNIIPENILFFDDKESNVNLAIENGMKARCVTGRNIDEMNEEINDFLNIKLK